MNAITEAQTVQDVVNAINSETSEPYFGGADLREPEEMAGQYACDAAVEAGFTDDDTIRFHLEFIQEQGALFDIELAFAHALLKLQEGTD